MEAHSVERKLAAIFAVDVKGSSRLMGRDEGDKSQTRRLAAILAADVAGYSRLIGADEEGTLNRLMSIPAEVLDPRIAEHRGRI